MTTQPSTGGIVSVTQTTPAESASMLKTPKPELHIANNGSVLVRGARVLSVSANIIHAHMIWGSSDFMWAVDTTYSTQYFDPKGEKETLADIQAGDMISVAGMLTQSGAESRIEAKFVRE